VVTPPPSPGLADPGPTPRQQAGARTTHIVNRSKGFVMKKRNVQAESDADLLQSIDLGVEIAEDARMSGNRQREAAAHEGINERLEEAERRGLFGGKR
jgi:hypothetical protein